MKRIFTCVSTEHPVIALVETLEYFWKYLKDFRRFFPPEWASSGNSVHSYWDPRSRCRTISPEPLEQCVQQMIIISKAVKLYFQKPWATCWVDDRHQGRHRRRADASSSPCFFILVYYLKNLNHLLLWHCRTHLQRFVLGWHWFVCLVISHLAYFQKYLWKDNISAKAAQVLCDSKVCLCSKFFFGSAEM